MKLMQKLVIQLEDHAPVACVVSREILLKWLCLQKYSAYLNTTECLVLCSAAFGK